MLYSKARQAHGDCELEITIRRLDVPPAEIGIFEVNTDPTPSEDKSLQDYQRQLEAKRKRKERRANNSAVKNPRDMTEHSFERQPTPLGES